MSYSRWVCISLNKWADDHPNVNPFENCAQIDSLGGADLYWQELLYRYGERTLYNPDRFILALKRLFEYNRYKYKRLLDTTTAVYPVFDNYKLSKAGSEKTTYDVSDTNSGTDIFKKGSKSTLTDGITITTTKTPRVETTTSETPGAKIKETVTPQTEEKTEFQKGITTKEETERGISTTVTRTPESYTDTISKTTYDDTVNFYNVQQNSRVGAVGGEEVTRPSEGKDTVTVSPVGNGKDTTTVSYVNGSKIETTVELVGDTKNTTVVSKTGIDTDQEVHTGTKSTEGSGQDETVHGKKTTKDGSETLSFTDRADTGYMYREPQNAIKDERSIAYFAILNVILEDVERVTLLSVY